MRKVPIATSARHIHISKNDSAELFGKGFELTKERQLYQPGEFACKEKIDIKTEAGKIKNLRIVGPLREYTQVELSKTDARKLKINPPIKECTSCQGEKAEKINLIGPKGEIERESAIIAHRHIHLNETEAEELNLRNHDKVSVKVKGVRAVIFQKVLIRAADDFKLEMHIDTDEANAAGIEGKSEGFIIHNS